MDGLFTKDYQWLWTVALALLLFLPVRHLIWIMSVRRAERREGPVDAAMRQRLKNRASFTAALACFVFSVVYVAQMFRAG
ncbi:MAG: hypothetical protein H6906_02940 [Hyphomicrobiales bacterium]|nr:hypothetical protein [Hyphomicrobiales bacterium]